MLNFNTKIEVISSLVNEITQGFQASRQSFLEIAESLIEKKNQLLSCPRQQLLDVSKKSFIIFLKVTASFCITFIAAIEAVQTARELEHIITVLVGIALFIVTAILSNIFFAVYAYPLITLAYKQLKKMSKNIQHVNKFQSFLNNLFQKTFGIVKPEIEQPTTEPQIIEKVHVRVDTEAFQLVIPENEITNQALVLSVEKPSKVSNNAIRRFVNKHGIDDLRAMCDFINDAADEEVIVYDGYTSRALLISKLTKHLIQIKSCKEQKFLAEFPRN
jgi:hypothetical protein